MDFRERANAYFDEYLADLRKLVSVESVEDKEKAAPGMPFGPNVARALDLMLSFGKEAGFETRNYDGYAGTISMGDGEECMGILGHLDVVPLGDGWSVPALDVTEKDGYLFGRGVLDDKGPTLAALFAMRMVKDAGIPLSKKVMLIAGCSEETGMEDMKYYREHGPIPDLGFTPDAEFPVIYGEKGNIHLSLDSEQPSVIRSLEGGLAPNIVIGKAQAIVDSQIFDEGLFNFYLQTNDLKGSIKKEADSIHISMEGTPAHASTPYRGVNAGAHLLNYIGAAYSDRLAQDLYYLIKDWKGSPEDLYMEGLYMGFLTMNPGLMKIEDGKAHVLVDIRYPNDTTPEHVLSQFEKACAKLESKIVPSLESAEEPLFVDPNSKLVSELMAAYQKYSGDTFHPAFTIGGGTYAKQFQNFVAFGPEKSWEKAPEGLLVGGCHQADEGIAKKDILEAMVIYADAIVRLAG